MTGKIIQLSKYSRIDVEKSELILDALRQDHSKAKFQRNSDSRGLCMKIDLDAVELNRVSFDEDYKYCPECGKRYPKSENVCLSCLVHLKNSSVDIAGIESDPQFVFEGKNSFGDFHVLLAKSTLNKINEFGFTYNDYRQILHNIKAQAFRNFDDLVKSNGIDFDSLDILDKIILFVKSFVKVEYKSGGGQLGYFERDTIYIDDRQTDSFQITTLLHELSHFLIQEILIHVVCKILDACRNPFIEALVCFILASLPFARLVDEYAAHNVEGRFTIFGFQDYSSFVQIERSLDGQMTEDEIEITKSIGNTFSLSIKDILESLIDSDIRKEIKDQFLKDVLDSPNYNALKMENCQILNDEGFLKSIWLILNEGCEMACINADKLPSFKSK